jgi:hypothetical protein
LVTTGILNEQNQLNYKEYCKIYNKVIRFAKVNYYTTKLAEYKHDMNETWKLLNTALNRNTKSSCVPTIFEINNKKITNEKDIAERFNTSITLHKIFVITFQKYKNDTLST